MTSYPPSTAARIFGLLLLVGLINSGRNALPADDSLFAPVATIFEKRCLECHNAEEKKGSLSLQTREALLAGGDSGAAISPGKPDGNLLLEMISGDQPEMPKTGAKLAAAEVALIKAWIAAGAPWPVEKK